MDRRSPTVAGAREPRADQHLIDLLHLGGRATAQRLAVLSRLARAPRHLTAIELHRDAVADGELIELSTVHRCLAALSDAAVVHCVYTHHGAAFGFNEQAHAHATCHSCGHTVDVDIPPVPELADTLVATGYSDIDVIVNVVSTCTECS